MWVEFFHTIGINAITSFTIPPKSELTIVLIPPALLSVRSKVWQSCCTFLWSFTIGDHFKHVSGVRVSLFSHFSSLSTYLRKVPGRIWITLIFQIDNTNRRKDDIFWFRRVYGGSFLLVPEDHHVGADSSWNLHQHDFDGLVEGLVTPGNGHYSLLGIYFSSRRSGTFCCSDSFTSVFGWGGHFRSYSVG